MRTQLDRRTIARSPGAHSPGAHSARTHSRGARWLTVVLTAALVMLGLVTSSASAQSGERIRSFDVTLIVGADGTLEVTEEITYDFGSNERRGILRDIPVRFHYDDVYDREYRLQVIDISSGTAPDQYQREGLDGGYTRLRIGDPDRMITGAHTYVIRYRVQGALNGFPEHDELYWNATGHEWDVPIDRATVAVHMPVEVRESLCFAGPGGSSGQCDGAVPRGRSVTFTHSSLLPYEGVTVVAAIPAGAVPTPEPILVERWAFTRAFALTPFTVGAAAALTILVGLGVARMLWVIGRDRRWAGSVVDARFGTPSGDTERVPLFEGGPFPVEYSPPGNLRPGLIGTLRDEVAHPLDVTSTIVDLATRHYLRIEEITTSGLLRDKTDWKLVRLEPPPGEPLLEYERRLLDALFKDGDEVEISSLRRQFHERLQSVQEALYEEVVNRGWYRRSPASTRNRWLAAGFVALGLSVGLVVLAAMFTQWGIVPIPLVLGSIALIAGHDRTPARTAKGSAALRQIRGFERFIGSAELYRSRFAEQARLFYDYLPYAVVFGLTDEWAKAFEGLAEVAEPDWYSGAGGRFAVMSLADNMTRFTQESTGAIASTPASSGSSGFGGGGFSGGGGGGGGGGSW